MAPVQEKRFLEYLFGHLLHLEFHDIILSVCYKKDVISNYFGVGEK